MSNFTQKTGTLISFNQPGAFHHKRALKYMDNNHVIDALFHLHTALSKEPDNIEYTLDLADLLTGIHHFDESNALLLSLIGYDPSPPSECYFGVACNFLGLGDLYNARSMLMQYLDYDPDGEFAEDVEGLLDAIEEDELEVETEDPEYVADGLQWLTHMSFIDENDQEKQELLSLLSTVVEEAQIVIDENEHDEQHIFILNCLCLLALFRGNEAGARSLSDRLLECCPGDVFTQTNALLIRGYQVTPENDAVMQQISKYHGDNQRELYRIAVTANEYGNYEIACKFAGKLYRLYPYEYAIIHLYAVSQYNIGNYPLAARAWKRLKKMDPKSQIYPWYFNQAQIKMTADHNTSYPKLLPVMQLPHEEVIARTLFISRMIHGYDQGKEESFDSEEALSILKWGITLDCFRFNSTLIKILLNHKDEDTVEYLKGLLLTGRLPSRLRRHIMCRLNEAGYPGPYAVLHDGHVHMHESGPPIDSLRCHGVIYVKVFEHFQEYIPDDLEKFIPKMFDIWSRFLQRRITGNQLPRIINPLIWAAALEYYAERLHGDKSVLSALADKYEVSPSSIRAALKKLSDTMEELT